MLPNEHEFGGRLPPKLLCSDEANQAIDNGLQLAELISATILKWDRCHQFTPKFLCECNRIAIQGIYACAGEYRTGPVTVGDFVPPKASLIPTLVNALCEYINQPALDPFHRAAYVLWRVNWIHPFVDGNGRVARELCYLALQTGLDESEPTGRWTIPELLDRERDHYYAALRAADLEAAQGKDPLPLSELESLLVNCYLDQSANPDPSP
jgi:Fic family protein